LGAVETAQPLAIDPSLMEAALRHAREVIADETRATREQLDDALRVEGLADAQLLPFAAIGADAVAATDQLERYAESTVRARGMTHVGVARLEEKGKVAVTAIFARRLLELTPLPRVAKTAQLMVRGRTNGTDRIEAFLLGPCDAAFDRCSTEARTISHRVQRGVLSVPLNLSGKGRYAFELVVTRERGPEVAALWSFDFGEVASPAKKTPLEDLGGLIDRARTEKELGPLAIDPALRTAAAAHASEVCKTMIAAHVFPESGDPSARAERAGYRGKVAENVAIAPTIARAHANLMKSPSHRKNVLDPLASRTGLAVVKRDNAYCVVELFGYGR
jgi:uncharacterized protein YkwD